MAITVIDQTQGMVSVAGIIHHNEAKFVCTQIVWYPESKWLPVKGASNKLDFVIPGSDMIFKTSELFADFITALTP